MDKWWLALELLTSWYVLLTPSRVKIVIVMMTTPINPEISVLVGFLPINYHFQIISLFSPNHPGIACYLLSCHDPDLVIGTRDCLRTWTLQELCSCIECRATDWLGGVGHRLSMAYSRSVLRCIAGRTHGYRKYIAWENLSYDIQSDCEDEASVGFLKVQVPKEDKM